MVGALPPGFSSPATQSQCLIQNGQECRCVSRNQPVILTAGSVHTRVVSQCSARPLDNRPKSKEIDERGRTTRSKLVLGL